MSHYCTRCKLTGSIGDKITVSCDSALGHHFVPKAQSTMDFDVETQRVLDCSVTIKSSLGMKGTGIAVSPTQLLTSLHGLFKKGEQFEVIDRHGIPRKAFTLESWYTPDAADIAIIELMPGATPFSYYISICTKPVKLRDEIYAIGRRAVGGEDEFGNFCERATVTMIVPNSAIIQTSYRGGDSFAGIVVTVRRGASLMVAGIYMDSFEGAQIVKEAKFDPSLKKRNYERSETEGDCMKFCEIARVEGFSASIQRV